MTEHKRNLTDAEEKAAHAQRDTKLDKAVAAILIMIVARNS